MARWTCIAQRHACAILACTCASNKSAVSAVIPCSSNVLSGASRRCPFCRRTHAPALGSTSWVTSAPVHGQACRYVQPQPLRHRSGRGRRPEKHRQQCPQQRHGHGVMRVQNSSARPCSRTWAAQPRVNFCDVVQLMSIRPKVSIGSTLHFSSLGDNETAWICRTNVDGCVALLKTSCADTA